MTRKEYISFANALAQGVATGAVMQHITAWLAEDNPRFDKAKFEAYLNKLIARYENERDHFTQGES